MKLAHFVDIATPGNPTEMFEMRLFALCRSAKRILIQCRHLASAVKAENAKDVDSRLASISVQNIRNFSIIAHIVGP